MDHQLSDELNMDMDVKFDHGADVVVSQADITLTSSDMDGMAMEFEHIVEQPMLLESGSEEIIGTEIPGLIDEQFTLSAGDSYIVQDGKVIETSLSDQSNILRSDTMMDLQFDQQTIMSTASTTNTRAQAIPIKTAQRSVAAAPKQVAIAPKPPPAKPVAVPAKHVAIAPKLGPKPVALTTVTRGPGRVAGLTTKFLSDVVQGQKGGQTFITPTGKQFVMMPAGASGQKIKLVPAAGHPIQTQYVTTKNIATGQVSKKPIMAKVIVTSQASAQQSEPAVITGIGVGQAPRFVHMQQKTIALSLGNKIIGSPTKHGLRFSKPKQHIVTVQSTSPKLVPASGKGVAGNSKLVLTDGVNNVVLKSVPHKSAAAAGGARSQIHQINVPGKGVQYIRLVTNPAAGGSASKPERPAVAMPAKNIVFTDNKGNIIQMAAEKVLSGGQPPPLLVAGGASLSKVTAKPQQKLVRIAPIVTKASHNSTMQPARAGQSLLAPIAPPPASPPPPAASPPPPPASPPPPPEAEAVPEDSKAALHALIEDAVRGEPNDAEDSNIDTHEVEVDFERLQSPSQEEESEYSRERQDEIGEHPLIVIPSNLDQRDDSNSRMEDEYEMSFMKINPDMTAYQQPASPTGDEELGDRPRRACNCTKSQCLKLYCDCFANGEFCNRCNCTNCHNNLENEELRQKAIRGCLDRNPNAFRPKIGKSRSGGPETIRRHNKGCNCKRSGCLKNYCECYEAKIACTAICKCVGCRNVELALERLRRREAPRPPPPAGLLYRPPPPHQLKQPCSFMTSEVIEAVCQCLLATGADGEAAAEGRAVERVLDEFARCLQDIIAASQQGPTLNLLDESM